MRIDTVVDITSSLTKFAAAPPVLKDTNPDAVCFHPTQSLLTYTHMSYMLEIRVDVALTVRQNEVHNTEPLSRR